MIRKFNYTGRNKINHSDLEIRLVNDDDGKRSFDITFDIVKYKFPENAVLYVEPYHNHSSMRFNFGNINNITPPTDRNIDDIPQSDIVLFRVKVVDETSERGKILARADSIRPDNDSDFENGKKTSILWVDYNKDLGQEIWRVTFGNKMPTLEINKRIENSRELIKYNKAFFALVYPSAVREVLLKLAFDGSEFDESGDGWESIWVKFIKQQLFFQYFPDKENSNEEQMMEWLEDVHSEFCRKFSILNKFKSANLF